jgi:hypothetical protein
MVGSLHLANMLFMLNQIKLTPSESFLNLILVGGKKFSLI